MVSRLLFKGFDSRPYFYLRPYFSLKLILVYWVGEKVLRRLAWKQFVFPFLLSCGGRGGGVKALVVNLLKIRLASITKDGINQK